jgi:hypothetical protein
MIFVKIDIKNIIDYINKTCNQGKSNNYKDRIAQLSQVKQFTRKKERQ